MEKTYNSICIFLQNLLGIDIVPSNSKISYPDDYTIYKVQHQGNIRWMNTTVYICASLAGEHVGIKKIDEQIYEVYFGTKQIDTLYRHRRCVV